MSVYEIVLFMVHCGVLVGHIGTPLQNGAVWRCIVLLLLPSTELCH